MTAGKIDVVVTCDAWAETAPHGLRIADIIEQSTLEEACQLASGIAAAHGPRCCVAIRVTDGGTASRVVEEIAGARPECPCTEPRVIAAMLARGADPVEVRNRIQLAHGHGLLTDGDADARLFI